MPEEMTEEFSDIYTLIDEEGNEIDFELLEKAEFEGKIYYAMAPVEQQEGEDGEYVILRLDSEENDEDVNLVTIEDDDEFDRVADFFDDLLFGELDYDEE